MKGNSCNVVCLAIEINERGPHQHPTSLPGDREGGPQYMYSASAMKTSVRAVWPVGEGLRLYIGICVIGLLSVGRVSSVVA